MMLASNFYPRPPRGGRPAGGGYLLHVHGISIHALREEGDLLKTDLGEHIAEFLSTPSARRATLLRSFGLSGSAQFLSTPSARRATIRSLHPAPANPYFYPRPPRGGRRDFYVQGVDLTEFLSTPSARRATRMTELKDSRFTISIHALREEGDQSNRLLLSASRYFYPRPPRGGRPSSTRTQTPPS